MKKTRNLSIAEYFDVLQREYMIADFRRKIYYNPKDKAYYRRVMEYKKVRIDDIASRNRLESIFTSESKKHAIQAELFDRLGRPLFEMNKVDLQNYYAIGNEFSYRGDVWILDSVNHDGTLTLYHTIFQQYEKAEKSEVNRVF